jgi:hypothetical protein
LNLWPRSAVWREVGVASLALLAITSLPYLYGYVSAPPDKWFSGVIYNVHDTAQYLSWMRESATRFFIDNKLTSEPNPAIFVNLHWWLVGRVGALLNLSLLQAYQLLRLITIPLYVGAAYWLCGLFFVEPRRRRFAFWLTTLTSGLGWIWVVYKQIAGDLPYPHDVYTTPGNAFWVILASPHLTLALALTLLTLGLAWLAVERADLRLSLAAALAALFLGLGHIYDLVTIWAVLGLFGGLLTLRTGFRWRTFLSLFIVVALSAPAALYFAWVSSSANPTWKQALAQYDNLGAFTPSPPHLLILLGVTFFLAVGALTQGLRGMLPQPAATLRASTDRGLFLKGWFVINLLIIYLPLRFQVMLLTGIQFVMAALATDFVFDRVIPWLESRSLQLAGTGQRLSAQAARWMPGLILLLVLPTNLYLFVWRFVDLRRYDYPFYLQQDDVAAMHWLEACAGPDDVVLSAFETGHYLPGLTGTHAFLSNAVMTLDFVAKRAMVERFFSLTTTEDARRALLSDYSVDYIFYGRLERTLGAFDPGQVDDLHLVFTSPQTRVYQVAPGASGCAPQTSP